MNTHSTCTHRVFPAFAIAFALAISGCASMTSTLTAQKAQPVTLVHPAPSENMRDVMRQTLAASKGAFSEQLQKFYSARDFDPAWTGNASREKDAPALAAILNTAHQHGLTDA